MLLDGERGVINNVRETRLTDQYVGLCAVIRGPKVQDVTCLGSWALIGVKFCVSCRIGCWC